MVVACNTVGGVSPNELVFDHRDRGPLAVFGDKLKNAEPPKNVLTHISLTNASCILPAPLLRKNDCVEILGQFMFSPKRTVIQCLV